MRSGASLLRSVPVFPAGAAAIFLLSELREAPRRMGVFFAVSFVFVRVAMRLVSCRTMLRGCGTLQRLGDAILKRRLCLLRHKILPAACLLLSVASSAFAQQTPADQKLPAFEVAAIKLSKPDDNSHNWNGTRDRISIENYTLRRLIRSAYELKSDAQIEGGPDWIDKQAFDITAKIDDAEIEKMRSMNAFEKQRERDQMLRALLADRFQLKIRLDHRVMPVYALVQASSGAKLKRAATETATSGHSLNIHNGQMTASAISMDSLADDLGREPETGGRVVLNRTGLTGDFDFKLDWAEDFGSGVPPDSTLPGLFTALQEQLGLRLKSEKDPVPIVVIESATKPVID